MFAMSDGVISGIVAGGVAIILAFLNFTFTRSNNREDRNETASLETYKAELEQMSSQRELLYDENVDLRNQLRQELLECRELRHAMEEKITELNSKVNIIEAELFAWRNGLKAPSGYILVKIPDEDL